MTRNEAPVHRPVMAREVVQILVAGGVDLLVDATVGAGGHSVEFLKVRGPESRVVGLDRDPEMIEVARENLTRFGDRVRLVARSFAELAEALDELGIEEADGALFDLGASSAHFDMPERGFSFLKSGPLDMRFDRREGETAADLVNRAPEASLVEIFESLGDERHARRIARAIVRERPLADTLRLAEVVERAVPGKGRIHSATRVFQALRMALNRELRHIESGIPSAIRRLRAGGRLVVISFHSGEDRVVKRLLREEARQGRATLITRKPMRPHADEVRENPRARSARLRACERGVRE
jgi:16S rRNA (cytosine1402-N4)-methyltransferase